MSTSLVVPPDARFTCASCGRCCQGWSVPVDEATVARLRAHDWGGEPFEATPSGGEPYRTRLVHGRCFFLDANNRCRIHQELSYEAKPVACRLFPLTVLSVEGRQHARLSYWCPTVVANSGKPLQQQQRWLRDAVKHADRRTAALQITDAAEITPADFERFHQVIRGYLAADGHPLADRLAALAGLARRLERAAAAGGAAAVSRALAETGRSEGAIAELAVEIRAGGRASGGWRVLSLFLLQDRPEGRLPALRRLAAVLLFRAGLLALRSRAVDAKASRMQVRRVTPDETRESEALLLRYFRSKVDSRRYVAGDATLVEGCNLLLSAYALIDVLARMRAVGEGRRRCTHEDTRAAISAADLLALEHAALPVGAVHRRLVKAALGTPGTAADLLAAATR